MRKTILPKLDDIHMMVTDTMSDMFRTNTGIDTSGILITMAGVDEWREYGRKLSKEFDEWSYLKWIMTAGVNYSVNGNTSIIINCSGMGLGVTRWIKNKQLFVDVCRVILHELSHVTGSGHDDKFYDTLSMNGVTIGGINQDIDGYMVEKVEVGSKLHRQCIEFRDSAIEYINTQE